MTKSDKVRIVCGGSKSEAPAVVDTSYDSILQVLSFIGKHPNDFNTMIVEAKVKPHLSVPCILWCDRVAEEVVQGLRGRGLCRDVYLSR